MKLEMCSSVPKHLIPNTHTRVSVRYSVVFSETSVGAVSVCVVLFFGGLFVL